MDWVQLSIRLPKDDHAKLKRLSEQQRRSLNGQVSLIIAEALAQSAEGEAHKQARADAR